MLPPFNYPLLGVPKWIRLALPNDVDQEISLTFIEYPHLTLTARRELIRYRLSILRYEVWNRYPCKRPTLPKSIRPSKLLTRRGYRKNKGLK